MPNVGRFPSAQVNARNMLPVFRYHPDPVATGSVKPSDKTCRCCGQNRGYIYTASVYALDELNEAICPFCIADGSAAKKFDATFSDSQPLHQAGVPQQVVDEVTRRTPGYASWQQEVWLSCCGDACEFHGDASRVELRALEGEALKGLLFEIEWSAAEWEAFVKHYEPGGNPAAYKFICRHCRRTRYDIDST